MGCLFGHLGGMNVITDLRCLEYSMPGHPERPARVERTVAHLKREVVSKLDWLEPELATREQIERAHAPEHIQRVIDEEQFDADTPSYDSIHAHASRSAGSALLALDLAMKGESAFSLMRPPGHHATRSRGMGFCYYNSIAIAALEALATGAKKVCVFDFDVHHGNGTEAILKDLEGTAFFSVHQHPCYPGSGEKNVGSNCYNFPVQPGLEHTQYRKVLEYAFNELLKQKPDVIAVSAGFDGYVHDPLAQMTLEKSDFAGIGKMISGAGVPFFSILEGGYSEDLPELIEAYLEGVGWKG
ncbi:histone deacetylase [Verrucomicrobia bacterium]|nr:histone deacetylase [Verrucomicrobiota bacterium]